MSERPDIRVPPPLYFLAAFVLRGLLPHGRPNVGARVVGVVLLVIATALVAGFVAELRKARTSIAFGTATSLVTTGPFQVSRNPGYPGMGYVTAGSPAPSGRWRCSPLRFSPWTGW